MSAPEKIEQKSKSDGTRNILKKTEQNSKSPMELKTFIRKLDKNQNLRWSWNFTVSGSIILSFNDWSVSKLTLNKLLEVLCQIYSCYEYSGNWRHGSQRVLGNFHHDPNECTIWIVFIYQVDFETVRGSYKTVFCLLSIASLEYTHQMYLRSVSESKGHVKW